MDWWAIGQGPHMDRLEEDMNVGLHQRIAVCCGLPTATRHGGLSLLSAYKFGLALAPVSGNTEEESRRAVLTAFGLEHAPRMNQHSRRVLLDTQCRKSGTWLSADRNVLMQAKIHLLPICPCALSNSPANPRPVSITCTVWMSPQGWQVAFRNSAC